MPERYRFERELADLGLREADTSVPTRRVAVGERIVLDVEDTPYGGYEIVKVRWTIPGKCITAYAATRKQAAVTDLSSADLEAKKIAFHWVDAKKQREVRATITYKDGSVQKDADI